MTTDFPKTAFGTALKEHDGILADRRNSAQLLIPSLATSSLRWLVSEEIVCDEWLGVLLAA